MQNQAPEVMAKGGREASRARRAALVQGKGAAAKSVPAVSMPEGGREASQARRKALVQGNAGIGVVAPTPVAVAAPVAMPAAPAPAPAPVAPVQARMPEGGREASRARRAAMVAGKGNSAKPVPTVDMPAGGREASQARRKALVQGNAGIGVVAPAPAATAASAPAATPAPVAPAPVAPQVPATGLSSGRQMAQAMRAERARKGRSVAEETRPTGRVRNTEALSYPAKVEVTKTYGAQSVTGVRIGRGRNVTGDEPGVGKPVSGTQYIAADGQAAYRAPGAKVGASKTENGLTVTGSQVRSKTAITGDEFRSSVSITGEADQTLADDLIERGDAGVAPAAQFGRQNNPHGASVFGTNLGRSIRHAGSRQRDDDPVETEKSLGGHAISGTALGRSPIVTGDEPGACRPVTGSQYLRAASDQPLCGDAPTPALARMGGMSARGESETWARQRITGVEVEFKPGVTGDEPGTCSPITGTPYSGPSQYETYCDPAAAEQAASRVTGTGRGTSAITGDIPLNSDGVTGTQRGAGNAISGTPYYRQGAEPVAASPDLGTSINRFSVKSPQRNAHLAADGEGGITGSFAVGTGKVTGNKEFDYAPRWKEGGPKGAGTVTGEGKVGGTAITGSSWGAHDDRVTGTGGTTAAGRNPTERMGKPTAFAGSGHFKGQGKSNASAHDVSGMAGTHPVGGDKSSARITLSGGARG